MKYLKIINKSIILFAVFALLNIRGASAQYAVGDYGSIVSGSWTAAATWGIWSGAVWNPAAVGPGGLDIVHVRAGHIVDVPPSGPYGCSNLYVEAGAKLWAGGGGTPIYITLTGTTFVCDGQVGNGAVLDYLSFNIESANFTISGSNATGIFDGCRLRKKYSAPTTNLTISRNINLRWPGVNPSPQLYSESPGTFFNITITAGDTVNLMATAGQLGGASIDGYNGADATDAGGTWTINGALIATGAIYMTTNNALPYSCKWIINGLVRANEIVVPASAAAKDSVTVNAGGKLELSGTPAFSTLVASVVANNNVFIFNTGSTVEYSAAGNQLVRVTAEFGNAAQNRYGYLILSNSGTKTTSSFVNNIWTKNDLTITGSAILDPVPINSTITVQGNWINYNSAGFAEKNTIVVFNNTTGGVQTISCPGGEVYYSMQYKNTLANVQLNNSVDIINQLSYVANGFVDLNSNTLTLINPIANGPTGAINGQTSTRYIVSEKPNNSSKIVWKINSNLGTYIFPFGIAVLPVSASNYIPVTVTKNSAASIGDLSFATYHTLPDNTPWPTTPTAVTNLKAYIPAFNTPDNRDWTVDRFWQVGSTAPSTVLDSVKFSYLSSELPLSEPSPTNMGAQFWNTTYWYPQQYGVPNAYSVSVDGFFVYNTAWTLTSLTSPLPIKLLYFDARLKEDKVELNWSTASETNNDYFTIEKSIDGINFFPIGNINGAGNTTTTLKYSLDDSKPVVGISYYRLKQTDFNGAFTYSNIVAVNYKKESRIFSIFPNPATDKAYLLTNAGDYQEIFVRNLEGKAILHYLVENSRQINPLQLTELKPGLYIIEVKTESDTQFLKLIKN